MADRKTWQASLPPHECYLSSSDPLRLLSLWALSRLGPTHCSSMGDLEPRSSRYVSEDPKQASVVTRLQIVPRPPRPSRGIEQRPAFAGGLLRPFLWDA